MSDAIETLKAAKALIDMDMKRSAIEAINTVIAALQHSGEPVARVIDDGTPEGATEWIPFCNRIAPLKTGDLLYTTPQPVTYVDAKREAESLAMSLWQKWYKDDSPDFELCDSVAGVITQINNMTTGLVREQDPQPVPEGYVLVPRAAATEVLRTSSNRGGAWEEIRSALLSAGKENNTHKHTVAILTEKWDDKTVTSAPFCIVCGESAGKGGE
jgi:hypothetical protein